MEIGNKVLSILKPAGFNVIINDTDNRTEHSLLQVCEADTPKGKDAGQWDFDKLGKCELCETRPRAKSFPPSGEITQQLLSWAKHSTWGN